MKKTIFLIIFTFLLYANNINAQNFEYSISATIISNNDSLLFGNLIVLSSKDSSIIKGTYFMDGQAKIDGITQTSVLIKITSLGYNDTIINVSNIKKQKLIFLGKIILKNGGVKIDEFTITAKLPLFEPSPEGGVKVNVQNTILASSTTLLDVLAKTPNVLVSGGSVSVFGKGEALIYLDGNPVTVDQLNSIPVSQVKSIEIISNPSARYDANGKAVINIFTIENHSEGWQGNVYHTSILAKSYLGSTNVNLNYRKNKWSLSAGYGLFLGRDWDQLKAKRTLTSDEGVFFSDNFHLNENKFTNFSNYNFGTSYKIDSVRKITLEYRGFYNLMNLNESVQNDIILPSGTESRLKTQNSGRNKRQNNSLVLNYIGDLDTLGSNFFFGIQYSRFNGDLNDLIREEYFFEDTSLSVSNRDAKDLTNISIFTNQIDYTKKFKNNTHLEAGAKYGRAKNTGEVNFYSKLENESDFMLINNLSNNFEYVENIPAGYLQYFGKIDSNFTYNLGVRTEYTNAEGFSKTLGQQVIDTNYLNLFPNASILYSLSNTFSIGLGYSSRIDRPKYQQLDPFIQYQDSLTTFQGNPNLLPELTHAFELNFNIQGFNFLKLGYNSSNNSFRSIVEQGLSGSNSVVLKTVNIQHLDSYFATLSIPVDLKGYSSYTTLSLSFDKITDDRPSFNVSGITPRLYAYSYHKLNVKTWFDFEMFGTYIGKQNDGIYFTEPTYSISCGVSKKIFKNKLNVRLLANDIFSTNKVAGNFQIGSTQVVYDTRLNTHFYQVALTYNFGNLKNITYNTTDIGKKEKERIE